MRLQLANEFFREGAGTTLHERFKPDLRAPGETVSCFPPANEVLVYGLVSTHVTVSACGTREAAVWAPGDRSGSVCGVEGCSMADADRASKHVTGSA